jgi:hypothetical protein
LSLYRFRAIERVCLEGEGEREGGEEGKGEREWARKGGRERQ